MLMLRDLIVIASIPFLASVILFLVFHNRKQIEFSYKKQQIIDGLIFGLIAVLATECGVHIEGTIVNGVMTLTIEDGFAACFAAPGADSSGVKPITLDKFASILKGEEPAAPAPAELPAVT